MRTRPIYHLDEDDEGEPSADFTSRAGAQDEAFVAAMRAAISRGKEKATEGVKTSDPTDNTVRRIIRPPTHVRSASSMHFD